MRTLPDTYVASTKQTWQHRTGAGSYSDKRSGTSGQSKDLSVDQPAFQSKEQRESPLELIRKRESAGDSGVKQSPNTAETTMDVSEDKKLDKEAEVLYNTVQWDESRLQSAGKTAAGLLFNIHCAEDAVCELHLPHCETEDGLLSVVHITDDGMSFLKPLEITDTHVAAQQDDAVYIKISSACKLKVGERYIVRSDPGKFKIQPEVAKVMPEDTFYFSIIRHPVTMMESGFNYFNELPAFFNSRSLEDFLDNTNNFKDSAPWSFVAHNNLAFDFGFDHNVTADAEDHEDKAKRAVAAIERDFHLMLVSEYFDESMILLKHVLCWSLEDVVSFKLNSRSNRTRHQISPNTAEKIKRWNALDWSLYLHFNATLWQKVDSVVGREQMKSEVSQLRELQVKLANTCLKGGGSVDSSQVKDAGLKPFQAGTVIQGYNLKPDLDSQTRTQCQRLTTPELQYTQRLKSLQFPVQQKQGAFDVPKVHWLLRLFQASLAQ
ncbi:galactose-3-O-sulfotransferase 2-like [Echeneis naucrates]|uniref:galactose-3-O-sulfotransferase 2-like n=1 Tax=Echeneis naucrates TaxID=173247 RepID=UPI001113C315|nr:galactose-3-O-sulfotransferase 2-like [Echeneis naucrates]